MSEVEVTLVTAVFKGIPNKKEVYRGDGLTCNVKKPKTCIVQVTPEKAGQLAKDFPKEWEFPDIDTVGLINIWNKQQSSIVAGADAKKGVRVIHADGKIDTYPAGTKLVVEKSGKVKLENKKTAELEKTEKPAEKKDVAIMHHCEKDDCNIITKKGAKFCKKHTE